MSKMFSLDWKVEVPNNTYKGNWEWLVAFIPSGAEPSTGGMWGARFRVLPPSQSSSSSASSSMFPKPMFLIQSLLTIDP